jgi:hypothetical protein
VIQQPLTSVTGLSAEIVRVGLGGMHPLFSAASIRRAFHHLETSLDHERLLSAHQAQRTLGEMTDIRTMRAYLATLPSETLDLVVFLYFRTLDRQICHEGRTLH